MVDEEAFFEGVEVQFGHLRYQVARDCSAAQVRLANEVLELVAL